jgi:Zn-dependent peptidase ImmA (M78 family)
MKLNLDALEVARLRNRLTKSAFAEKLGISSRDMRRMRESREVSSDFIAVASSVTGFPAEFFCIDDDLSISQPTFRKQATLSARERGAGEAAAKLAKLFWSQVEKEYSLPEPDLPDYSNGDLYIPDGIDRATYAASLLREEWGLGSEPIGNIVTLLERHGVRVLSLSEQNTRGLSAFTFWGENETPFIYLNMVGSMERSRFDAAHELGHLVLHRHHDSADVDVEEEADRFASAFLIPNADLLRHKVYPTISNIRRNKKRWNVSVAALVRAYRDSGLIDDNRYKYLNIELSRNGWRKSEPDRSPWETSGVWSAIRKDLWAKKETVGDLAKRALVPEEDAITFTSFGTKIAAPQHKSTDKPKHQLRIVE